MSTNSTIRALRWLGINSLFATLMWFGFGPDRIDGARYVYTFFLCVTVFFAAVAAFNKEVAEAARQKGRPVPAWVDSWYEFSCMAFLVWHGSWGIALIVLFSWMCMTTIYAERKAAAEEQAA